MPVLHRDYETRSTVDLRVVGADVYAQHPTTDVWVAAYCVDDGEIKLWKPGDPVPPEFLEAARNPDCVSAHNARFERLIEAHIMGPRYGWPTVPLERHRCTMAMASALALPAKLEKVAEALKLEQQKDKNGHRLILQMSRPRKPRPGEDPSGVYWLDDPERLERGYAYVRQDVRVERELYGRLSPLIEAEQRIYIFDQRVNDRRFHVDGELLDGALRIAEEADRSISAEMQAVTAGVVTSVNQVARLIAWLAGRGCEVKDVQKGTLRHALRRKNIPQEARRAIELRLDGAHASAAKLDSFRGWRNGDGRIRGAFRYHGASTGRWTSHGVQVQNLKRPEVDDIGAAIEAVKTGDYARVRELYPQPLSIVGDIARAMICAAPGHRLIAADFSGVESRVTAWVSGQQSKLDQWATFDRTKDPADEPYTILGKQMGVPEGQARIVGKTADLAFGFMGGPGAWRTMAALYLPDDDSDEATIKQRQQLWRSAHPSTVRFWGKINRAAIKATQTPGTTHDAGGVTFKNDGTFLFMRLPSGRSLAYPFASLMTTDRGDLAVTFKDYQQGKWQDCRHGHGAYGGTWIENAVQAIARDVFAEAMLRLEAAGYPIVLHVHDEIVAEVPDGFGTKAEFERLITTPPQWADGMPIAAKVRVGPRFCKASPPKRAEPEPPWEDASKTEEPIPTDADPAEEAPRPKAAAPPSHDDSFDDYKPQKPRGGRVVATYIYEDIQGDPYLRVEKTDRKDFWQSRWTGSGWIYEKPDRQIPYRLRQLLAASNESAFITEGEKDSNSVASLGLIATTNPGGAGKWAPELNMWFSGRRAVYLLEDNDDAGADHVAKIAKELRGIVDEIRNRAHGALRRAARDGRRHQAEHHRDRLLSRRVRRQ
jgi:DNA polymerase